jgi:hypothetical protein
MNKKPNVTDNMALILDAYRSNNMLPTRTDGLKALIRLVAQSHYTEDKTAALYMIGRYLSYGIPVNLCAFVHGRLTFFYVWVPVLEDPKAKFQSAGFKVKTLESYDINSVGA